MPKQCTHVKDHMKDVKPHTKGCEECLQSGDTWVHLRMCLECGHVGCCDSSKNRHARGHFHTTQHPLIRSAVVDLRQYLENMARNIRNRLFQLLDLATGRAFVVLRGTAY